MKNIFKKAILPLLVFGIAIASVFATNSNKIVEQPSQPVHTGPFLYYDAILLKCDEISENMDNCTIVSTGVFCTLFSGGISINLSTGSKVNNEWICTVPLYERTIP